MTATTRMTTTLCAAHMHGPDEAAELQVLTAQFIDGFVAAKDKMSYLRLAGVPLEKPGAVLAGRR